MMTLDELRDEIAYESAAEFMATKVIEEDCELGIAIRWFWRRREELKGLLQHLQPERPDDIEHQLLGFDEKIHEYLMRTGSQYRWYLYKAGISKENAEIIEKGNGS